MNGMRCPQSEAAWRVMAWLSLALAAVVAKAEADAVIGEVTPTGQYTTSAVYGPGQLIKPLALPTSAFHAWAEASRQFGDLWLWLLVQVGFDVVFIVGYVGLGVALIAATQPESHPGLGGLLRRWWPLAVLAAANLVQGLLSVAAFAGWIRLHRDVPAALIVCLQVAVTVKWLLVIVFLAVAAYRLADNPDVREQLALIAQALKKQRFSVVIVALLTVIAIAKGNDVLEQMPDVQRAWITWPPSLGWAHLAFAVTAQCMLAILLALLGALRAQHAHDAITPGDRRDKHTYRPWLLITITVPAIALIARYTGIATVSWYNVIPIPALAALVIIASWLSRNVARDANPEVPAGADQQERYDAAVRTAGNLLAVAVIAVTGLGLVRSFTAAAMVIGRPYSWAFGVAVAVGFAVATLSWAAARGPVRYLADRFAMTYHSTGRSRDRTRTGRLIQSTADQASQGDQGGGRSPGPLLAVLAIPAVVADVLLVFEPMWTTHWLGVLATTVIALGTLAVGLTVLAYLAQSRKPLPVFRMLRLKSTPVISLILIAGVAGTLIGKSSQLHDIRLPPAVARASRTVTTQAVNGPTLADSLQQWLNDPATTTCAVPAPSASGGSGVRVMPMVLIAAAGGGIRAAWWTVQALQKIDASPCGKHAVFLVSGVSGGSLGLAITDTTADPQAALARVAGPDGLAAAIDGLLLRDTIAGMTGLDLTAASMPPGQRFPDRAALLEQAWQNEDPALAAPFPLASPRLPWRILMNTTAVGTGCRAIIADRLLAAGPVSAGLTCDLNSGAPLPDSYDFFAHLPCLRGIATVTAALLSARFPYVTPSGVVDACGQAEQYVDGGYADSTGLATIAGLAPELMSAVRQYNANALATHASGHPVTLVVPVTAYLGNSPQAEPVTGAAPGSPPQFLIPVSSGASGAQTQLSGSTALLQWIFAETSATEWLACPANDKVCAQEQAAAAATVPQQLILVVPREYPAVATPLGWILSAATRTVLTNGLAIEAASTCPDPAQNEPYCPAHVGRLGDLLRLISRTPVS
jgi:hypothetical protein